MARTKKEIFFLVIGLLVSPFVFKGQCEKVKGEEPEYIIFPKAFFSSNADNLKGFLSNNVLIDDVTDSTKTSSSEPSLSPSSDESITRFNVEETTGVVFGPGVASERFTDDVIDKTRTSSSEPPLSPSSDESTTGFDFETTGGVSSPGIPCENVTVHAASGSTHQWHQWNNSYYASFTSSEFTWEEARERCRSFCGGVHLVFIESDQENLEISRLAFNVTGQRDAKWWIGLNDRDEEGSWKWEDVSVTYNKWHNGEPNNGGEYGGQYGEDCAVLTSRDGDNASWNDVPCNEMRRFICEKDLKGDT